MNGFLQDLRYGWRALVRSPGFTAVAVLTLALGIGANSSIFSLINAVLLRPLPYTDPDRLVAIWERRASSNEANLPISAHEFVAWREQALSFEGLGIFQGAAFNLTGTEDPAQSARGWYRPTVCQSLAFLRFWGEPFCLGEDQAGNDNVVILSEGLWKRRFGSDPLIVGKPVKLNDRSYTVVGVIPSLDVCGL